MMQYKKQENTIISVKELVFTALMAALIFVATRVFQIPTPNKGYIHLGDSMLLIAAVLLGKKKGFAAGAIGMMFADLTSYPIWAPFTFVVKGIMALIAASIALRKDYNGENVVNNIFAFVIAGIWMVVGYYFVGAAIMYFISGDASSLGAALIASAADVLPNIIQAVSGIVIATVLLPIISKIYKQVNRQK